MGEQYRSQYRSPESNIKRMKQARLLDQNRTPEEKAVRAARRKELKFEKEMRKLNHLPRAQALKIVTEKLVVIKQDAKDPDSKYSFC